MADNKEIIKCPACGEDMVKVLIPDLNIYVDICLNGCGGMLFDNRELEKFDEPHENIDDIKTTYPRESETAQVLVGLMNLPNRYRKVLILYYYEGYKCNEIGNILRITESAVKKRLERGRKLLKQELKED